MESMENFKLHRLVVAEPDAALVTDHALDKSVGWMGIRFKHQLGQ
jgi:hypothetical protein